MNLDTEATESLNVPSDFVSAIRLTIQAHQFIQKHVHICNWHLSFDECGKNWDCGCWTIN